MSEVLITMRVKSKFKSGWVVREERKYISTCGVTYKPWVYVSHYDFDPKNYYTQGVTETMDNDGFITIYKVTIHKMF